MLNYCALSPHFVFVYVMIERGLVNTSTIELSIVILFDFICLRLVTLAIKAEF